MELGADLSNQIESRLRKYIIHFLLAAVTLGCHSPQVTTSLVPFQLSDPQVKVDSLLFRQATTITAELDQPGVEIYYAMGRASVSRADSKYEGPITLQGSAFLSMRAFHPSFQASDPVRVEVRKVGHIPRASIGIDPQPQSPYVGLGAQGLIDLKKGRTNFRSGLEWLGFQSRTVKVEINFDQAQLIEGISLSTLQSHGDWIFLPSRLEVTIGNQVIASREFGVPSEQDPIQLKFLDLPFPDAQNVQSLELTITNHAEIPAWHPGSGTPPWLFIDEIIIN